MAVLAAGGCVHTAPPGASSAARPAAIETADLDSLAYARQLPKSVQTNSVQSAQAKLPPPMQRPAPQDAHAKVVPVAVLPEPTVYWLDSGDKLRVVVFGQEGLSNSYFVDAAGQVTMPLIGPVGARGLTTQQLSRAIAQKLRAGFIREPHVAIEVEVYRPFFILGEVTQPGQYPFVPNMTVETAVAIAGGFTPRAFRHDVMIDRPEPGGVRRGRASVPLLTRVRPGDTIVIQERWF